ncbi:DUF3105 domain-containing protein [Actinokineospora soli]|uniref:DUF3105 domain-containing protein n=1 Tax=Actinokineospora soli TaxID=1048753 RepID=A0ABW2TV50_9PSEU
MRDVGRGRPGGRAGERREDRGTDQDRDQDEGGDQGTDEGGPDPTAGIEGVLKIDYPSGIKHVAAPQRVAYDHLPPLGGAHDFYWAPCMGQVFTVAVRTEHFVHSMEHGAVWITYDPEKVTGDDLEPLVRLVEGQPYLVMSPFPGQGKAVSAQAWGRQLQVDAVDDPRIPEFIAATRGNPDLSPEPGRAATPRARSTSTRTTRRRSRAVPQVRTPFP